jgi:Leucine-rich repeat (LRR) protein
MGEMPSLRKLYLNNNKIMFVPTELGYLPKLTLLRLVRPPLSFQW